MEAEAEAGVAARPWMFEGVQVLVEVEAEAAGLAARPWMFEGVQVLVEAKAEAARVAWLAGVGLVGESVWVWWQTLRI